MEQKNDTSASPQKKEGEQNSATGMSRMLCFCGECAKYKTPQCGNHDGHLSPRANACPAFLMLPCDD